MYGELMSDEQGGREYEAWYNGENREPISDPEEESENEE